MIIKLKDFLLGMAVGILFTEIVWFFVAKRSHVCRVAVNTWEVK